MKDLLKNLFLQLIRYFFVSGAAFAADFGVYALMIYLLHCHYLLSACGGFLFGVLVNYVLCKLFVFTKKTKSSAMEFTVYFFIGILGLGLLEILLYLMVGKLHIHAMLGKLFATGIVFFWNFFAKRIFIYSDWVKKIWGCTDECTK